MFSISYITVIIVFFFLFYNAIGENGSLTHSRLLNFRKWIDYKILIWIRRLKNTPFSNIDSHLHRKLYYAPFIILVLVGILTHAFKPSIILANWVSFLILLIGVFLFGFVSAKRVFQSTKKTLTKAFPMLLFALAFGVMILFEFGIDGIVKGYHLFLSEAMREEGITGVSTSEFSYLLLRGIISFVLASFFLWAFYRFLTKYSIIIFIAFARFCYDLNNKKPLRSFHFIFQAVTVFISLF